MRNTRLLITTAIAGLTTGSLLTAAAASAADVKCAEQERCYGVAKAGKNDCATATSACAGTAKQDFQKDAWVYVPKGSCLKLAGGATATDTKKK
jgi:uncharacterized membrane protein